MNDDIMNMFGLSKEVQAVKDKICPFCKEKIVQSSFVDELSFKEYKISGLCMKCQDEIFANPSQRKKKQKEKTLSKESAATILGIDLEKVVEESSFGNFDHDVKIEQWERIPSTKSTNTVYFLPFGVENHIRASKIHCQTNFGSNKKSEGYGGSIWKFQCTDGKEYEVQGPWHSNSSALREHTGIDLTNKHKFFIVMCEKSAHAVVTDGGRLRYPTLFDKNEQNDTEYHLRSKAGQVIWNMHNSYMFHGYNLLFKYEWIGSYDNVEMEVVKKVKELNMDLYYVIKSSGGSTTFTMTVDKAKEKLKERAHKLSSSYGIK